MSSRWKETNAKTRRDWRCEEVNPCQSEEGALAWDRQLCLGQWRWTRRGWRQPQGIQWERERRAKGRVRLHRAHGTTELSEVASGSATQSLLLRNGKVRSQVSGIDRSRFPGRGTVRRKGRRASDSAEKRVYRFRVRFGWKRRASRLPWPWRWLTRRVEKRRCKPGDLSLTVSSISADQQALGGRLMRPNGMEDLAASSAREVKRTAAEERDEYSSAEG